MARARSLISAAALAALSVACATVEGVRFAAPDLAARLPASVAVLPFDNQSVNLDAPGLVRRDVEGALRARGWRLADPAGVDAALERLGVTDGGQLPALDPAKLGSAVGTPGLLFGAVEEFTYENVGFARRRAVRLSLRLVEAASGARLWEAAGEESTGKVELDPHAAGRSFMKGVAEQAAETAQGRPLARETRTAVEKVLSYLPVR